MCGRFWASLTWEQYRKLLNLIGDPPEKNFRPNRNIAPPRDVLTCSARAASARLEQMCWGLIPPWAKEPPKFSTIDAKSELLKRRRPRRARSTSSAA
ncbi:MAG: SOS response-associated peptidase family protein [Amphiplicatus sp.]